MSDGANSSDDPVAAAFRRLVGTKFAHAGIDARIDPSYRSGDVHTIAGGPFGYTVTYRWSTRNQPPRFEVFESNRMSGDDLCEIGLDGQVTDVAAAQDFFAYGPDATDAEKAEKARAYEEHNRRFYADVELRGLLRMTGLAAANAYLRSGGDAQPEVPDSQSSSPGPAVAYARPAADVFDSLVADTVARAAAELSPTSKGYPVERGLEDAFLHHLSLPAGATAFARRKVMIPGWAANHQPGPLDVGVTHEGVLVAAAELKVNQVNDALYDLFKLAGLFQLPPRIDAAYLIVGAYENEWASQDFAHVFPTGPGPPVTHVSRELLQRHASTWMHLMAHSSGQLRTAPSTIDVRYVANCHVPAAGPYHVRVVGIRPGARATLVDVGEGPPGPSPTE